MKKIRYSSEVRRQMSGRKRARIRIDWKEVGSCVAAILYGIAVVALFGLYLFLGGI